MTNLTNMDHGWHEEAKLKPACRSHGRIMLHMPHHVIMLHCEGEIHQTLFVAIWLCSLANSCLLRQLLQLLASPALELGFDLPRSLVTLKESRDVSSLCWALCPQSVAEHRRCTERSAPYRAQPLSREPWHKDCIWCPCCQLNSG